MLNISLDTLIGILVAFVPAVACVVTTLLMSRQNSKAIDALTVRVTALEKDVSELKVIMAEMRSSFRSEMDTMRAELKGDIATIKAICQERYRPMTPN